MSAAQGVGIPRIGKRTGIIALVDATNGVVDSMMGATNITKYSGIEASVKTDIRINQHETNGLRSAG